nr:hypothetical protein [Zhihengliuella flava]
MPLASAEIQRLQPWAANFSGFERVEIAAPAGSGEALILLVPRPGLRGPAEQAAARAVAEQFSQQASLGLLTQETGAAADGSGSLQRVAGRTWLTERVSLPDGGVHAYRVTGEGFWQIHRAAPAALTEAVLNYLDPQPGERIADLYAGAGLFTVPVAEAVGERGLVLSIEGAPGTSRDARRNVHSYPQAIIAQGRVEKTLRTETTRWGHAGSAEGQQRRGRQAGQTGRLDAVVLDPPRAGAGRAGVDQIARTQARRIAYVSCDPASFARDAADFERRGYRLEAVRALDLYPNTHHVETIGRFVRV